MDRKRAFVIYDSVTQGPATFHASKRRKVSGHKLESVAAREHGTDKFCKVLRFFIDVPPNISKALNEWVAVPKLGTDKYALFYSSALEQDSSAPNESPLNPSVPNGSDGDNFSVSERRILQEFLEMRCAILS